MVLGLVSMGLTLFQCYGGVGVSNELTLFQFYGGVGVSNGLTLFQCLYCGSGVSRGVDTISMLWRCWR